MAGTGPSTGPSPRSSPRIATETEAIREGKDIVGTTKKGLEDLKIEVEDKKIGTEAEYKRKLTDLKEKIEKYRTRAKDHLDKPAAAPAPGAPVGPPAPTDMEKIKSDLATHEREIEEAITKPPANLNSFEKAVNATGIGWALHKGFEYAGTAVSYVTPVWEYVNEHLIRRVGVMFSGIGSGAKNMLSSGFRMVGWTSAADWLDGISKLPDSEKASMEQYAKLSNVLYLKGIELEKQPAGYPLTAAVKEKLGIFMAALGETNPLSSPNGTAFIDKIVTKLKAEHKKNVSIETIVETIVTNEITATPGPVETPEQITNTRKAYADLSDLLKDAAIGITLTPISEPPTAQMRQLLDNCKVHLKNTAFTSRDAGLITHMKDKVKPAIVAKAPAGTPVTLAIVEAAMKEQPLPVAPTPPPPTPPV